MLGELIAEGRTSRVYAFGDGEAAKVLNADVPAHWAESEAAFTNEVRLIGVRAPEVRDITVIDGRPTIVFERITGPSMWDEMLARPHDLDELIEQFAVVQRMIQRAGVPENVPSSVDRMCAKIDSVEALAPDDRARACEMVRSLPSGGALLHGDLHPGNVLMAAEGPVVIDWFDATVGHPVIDVVRSSLLLRSTTGGEHHLAGSDPDYLRTIHERYVVAMADVLSGERECLADYEAVAAASRLAEGTDPDPSDLMRRWTGREGVYEGLGQLLDRVAPRSPT